MDPARRAFYRYHSTIMEAWDGPALAAFTDGSVIGAVLDRNGLRPARYWVTEDGLVVLGSEVGVLEVDPASVVRKGRLEPGRMFLVDTVGRRIVDDDEIKGALAAEHPYDEWLHAGMIDLARPARAGARAVRPRRRSCAASRPSATPTRSSRSCSRPMADRRGRGHRLDGQRRAARGLLGAQPVCCSTTSSSSSRRSPTRRWTPTARSSSPRCRSPSARRPTCSRSRPASCRRVVLPLPVIDDDELAQIIGINDDGEPARLRPPRRLRPLPRRGRRRRRCTTRLAEIREEVSAAVADGARVIVLSDRHSDADRAPIPTLLLTGAVHQHLVREKTRTQVDLVVEAGDVRETHHVSLLLGYGASAVNPYLALDTVADLIDRGVITGVGVPTATRNVVEALAKGVRKVMSKMGVSTVASYIGAQIFEAIGLGEQVVADCFAGTTSRLGGVGYDVLAEEVAIRHRLAWPADGVRANHRELAVGGEYQWRREGELHVFNPHTVFKLQHSTRTQNYDIFKEYTRAVDEQSSSLLTLRGLFDFAHEREPVPIEEVEPVSEIVKRFNTGAISYGSISQEMHEVLAIAMNRLGGRSNTGEGGEDPDRFTRDANGDSRRSAVKQVASGRFGVTSEYLVNADDIQIKIAQGAKPGEGGQLPGHKVYPWIAKTRYSTPGVGLISPPPHHDIYSIEDIAQLIHDLKNANPRGADPRQAGLAGRGRDGRRGRVQGQGRRRAHLRPRRRDGRLAAVVDQARGRAVGARPRRDPADAAAQRPARPHRRADRRPAEDRPRRHDRRAARGRGVRLRDGPAGGERLHHDAGLPPRHLSGRRRDAEPGAAGEVQRQGRVRRGVHGVRRPGGARAPRGAGLPHARRGRSGTPRSSTPGPPSRTGRPRGSTCRRSCTARSSPGLRRADAAPVQGAGPRAGEGAGPHPDPARRGRDRRRLAGAPGAAGAQRQPHRRHHARLRGDQALGRQGPARRHHRRHLHRVRRASRSAPSCPAA